MAGVQLVLPGEIVKKSNALLRCRWSIDSVWEPRLVALLASQVRTDDIDFKKYEIPVISIIPDSVGGTNYREIEKTVDSLMQRVLTIYSDTGWKKYHLFNTCEYNKQKNIIIVEFHPELKEHYLELKRQFAKYNLLEFLLLPSIYSQRMFEILKSWDDRHEVIIPISELYDMLDAPDYLRESYKEFRHRVLEKSYKDITTKTSLRYEWEGIKKGRSIIAIKFTFPHKQIAQHTKQNIIKNEGKYHQLATACAMKIGEYGTCYEDRDDQTVCEYCKRHNIFAGHKNPISQYRNN